MDSLLKLIADYGYLAIFGLLALGIVGLPIPDETIMTFVGYLSSHGTLSYVPSLLISFTGSMTGMLISFLIGRKLGIPVIYRYGKWIKLTPERLERTSKWFHKYGIWSVSFGYFIPGVRHFTSYLAGASRIPFWKYLLFAGTGAWIWCTTFITLGFFIREKWEMIGDLIHQYLLLSLLAVVVIAAIVILLIWYRKKMAQKMQ